MARAMMAGFRSDLARSSQFSPGLGPAPFAAGVVAGAVHRLRTELAHHVRAHVGPPVVELLLELVLDDLALLLDHQDFLQPGGELARARGLQRPHHRHLVQADAQARAGDFVQAQIVERLAGVVVGLAAGDQAQARARAVDHRVVQAVGADVGQRGVPLVVHQPGFLLQRRIGPADVQAARRHGIVFRQPDLHAVRIDFDGGRGFDHLLDGLQSGPQAREAAHGPGMQAQVEDLLHARGEEDRQAAGLEDVVALVGCGAALGHMVVAGHRDHAAVARGARHVGVLEDVGAAVHARPLAVPQAEDAIELALLGVQIELLGTPHRGGGQLFIHPGLEDDVLLGQMGLGSPEGLIVGAERRAPVAADEAGGVQAGHRIALALQHGQTHQGVHTAHEDTAVVERVLVVEADGFERASDGLGQRGIHRGPLLVGVEIGGWRGL